MPYNRAKGRTCEIPPSPSPGGSRLGVATDPEGRSRASSFSASVNRLISPHDINARLESQLAADVGRSEHDDDHRRRWLVLLRWPAALPRLLVVRPLGFVIALIGCAAEHTPPVVPAVVAMVFLYVAMPLLIAWGLV
ncbi:hypothetical protein D7B24_007738 [Verticillium nonalfalfae]|uniref:Uncharacterized protein n=1 Tax=Verticillium nonalfalfae TaxID=1051616 RepID=A0A3M9YAG4_9PEZI|nr:uncharacterized protein D7B24_007738 [Verticillium nonalfalfae]RNJ56070.1 hypothetical protein D7B24_007738 [Verticillium nonalfalfae]